MLPDRVSNPGPLTYESGAEKNLNKITKIKHIYQKFNTLFIFVILYSLQCKIEGHVV